MYKHIIFSTLIMVLLFSCKKDDGAIPKDVVIDAVPQPSVVKNGGSASIDLLNLGSFQGKFDVSLLYPSDVPPAKMDVVIRKNNNNSNVKLVQADVSTYPTSFTITAAQIAAYFGAPIVLGDNYDIGVDIYTKSGNKYQAFPLVGAAYGSTGVANQPNFSPTTRYSAICAYDPTIYQGNFVVVSDEFDDFPAGSTVALTQVSATKFSFTSPAVQNPLPIVLTVDAANNLSAANQKIGDWFLWNTAYTNPKISVTGNGSSFVSPCARTVTVVFNYTVDQGSFGAFKLILRKP